MKECIIMYISNVYIENFRSFTTINVPLNPFTILIGKNDSGKSNLIDAINILLYNSRGNYYAKSLSKYDFNLNAVVQFKSKIKEIYKSIKQNISKDEFIDTFVDELIKNAPVVIIRLRFSEPKTEYERSLLRGWLNGDEEEQYFEVEYKYHIKNRRSLVKRIKCLVEQDLLKDYFDQFEILLEYYDYDLISTNNGKTIDFTKIKNFVANNINAERDAFSSGESAMSTKTISKIIDSSLSVKDHTELIKKYNNFFDGIQELDSFRSIYNDIIDQNETVSKFIEEIKLAPNAKKYRDILENITISYGNDMLFQRGLGTRNLILLLTLYSYYLSDHIAHYNMVSIEEPESHLDINSLKVAIEFFDKAKDRNSLVQLLISTHSNLIINKLKLDNVTLIADDHTAIGVSDIDQDITKYLSKRENFDTLKLLFASKVILVEGATEEIYLNSLLQKQELNNICIISIGQKGFKTFIEIWLKFHTSNSIDKLGVIRDYDWQDKAKNEHEAYNSDRVFVSTAVGKEFESDLVSQSDNLRKLNKIFSLNVNAEGMYQYLIEDKLNNILQVCEAFGTENNVETPQYINSLLEWIKL